MLPSPMKFSKRDSRTQLSTRE